MEDRMQTTDQIKTWINEASPDDLLAVGKAVTGRIAQLDQTYRDRFVQNLDPTVAKLFDKTHA